MILRQFRYFTNQRLRLCSERLPPCHRIQWQRYSTSNNGDLIDHHDLASYLKYSQLKGITNDCSVYKGTLYEYHVQLLLKELVGISSLRRVGSAGDNGVDLEGYWSVSNQNETALNILVQCKSSNSKVTARLFREMEGVFNYHVQGTNDHNTTLVFLASPSTITKQGLAQFERSSVPMVYFVVDNAAPKFDANEGKYDFDPITTGKTLRGIMTNQAALELLKRYDIHVKKYIPV